MGDHISKIGSKANSTLGFFRRNLKGCPSKLKEIAYFLMVRSLLEYSFLYKTIPDWNHLPPAGIESRSIAAFKSPLSDYSSRPLSTSPSPDTP